MVRKIELFDTTLRDGSQAHGISFSIEDKLGIISALDTLCISYIEPGTPGSNPKDQKLYAHLREDKMQYRAKIVAFGSTRRKNTAVCDDPGIRALEESGANVIAIFGKSWRLHVSEVLGTTEEENLRMISDTIAHFKQKGCEVIFDAEHFFSGYRDDPAFAMRISLTRCGSIAFSMDCAFF